MCMGFVACGEAAIWDNSETGRNLATGARGGASRTRARYRAGSKAEGEHGRAAAWGKQTKAGG